MPTEVVVATIVKTRLSEAGFRRHMVEQLQVNDRSLRDKLADADRGANVITAVLNVDELLAYLVRRHPTAVDAPAAPEIVTETIREPAPSSPTEASLTASVSEASLTEEQFMNYMFDQLETGAVEPLVHFPAGHWDDDEEIGEDFSRHPFYY